MIKTILKYVGVGLVGLMIGYFAFGGDVLPAGQTHLSGLAVGADGLTVTGATTLSGATTASGLLKTDAGTLRSSTNSTSTLASMTMRLSDVNGYDVVLVSPIGAAATKVLTFFASSTATAWLPAAGDMQETCFYNATGTVATTLTFAAGTGIDLETASSSPTDLIILAGNTACFKFIRQPATASTFDISALMTEYTNGD